MHLTTEQHDLFSADHSRLAVRMIARTHLPADALMQRSSPTTSGAVPLRSTTLVELALKPGQLPEAVRASVAPDVSAAASASDVAIVDLGPGCPK